MYSNISAPANAPAQLVLPGRMESAAAEPARPLQHLLAATPASRAGHGSSSYQSTSMDAVVPHYSLASDAYKGRRLTSLRHP